MAGYPDDLRYTESHAWLRPRDAVATLGVTEVLSLIHIPSPRD